ncbi:MAG: ribbon-helix-helix protein, CopG family [Elusimicrobia bacterium]|nr:ribbon-helix-helix protein, CopG family [Elusimicrobiota bacterium]
MPLSYRRRPKLKLSAAIFPWTVEALDRFRREKGLRSRSEAVAEALAEWAADYRKESLMAEAVARYGAGYAQLAGREEAEAKESIAASLPHTSEP